MNNQIETNVVKPALKFFKNEVENVILNNESELALDSRIENVESFIKQNKGKGKKTEEKDELYESAQKLWKEYAFKLRETKYNFFLDRPQYNFLTDLITKKLEYDVNTVFFAIELTQLMGSMKNLSKYTDDTSLIAFPVNATEITYIYHLISNYKVKGLVDAAYKFAEVLRMIGDISKIFNYYDTFGKSLSTDIHDWVITFEDNVITSPSNPTEEVVEGSVSNA